MGRYYDGDISGKFWFAVQPSNAADRFGVTGEQTHISYTFDEYNLNDIYQELNRISEKLGNKKEKLDRYFEKNWGYNEEEIAKYLKIPINEVSGILREYADFQLGTEIANCIEKTGSCCFDAEL